MEREVEYRTIELPDYDIGNILLLLKEDVRKVERQGAPILIVDNQKRLRDKIQEIYDTTEIAKEGRRLFGSETEDEENSLLMKEGEREQERERLKDQW
jgi:hypothetical protein